MVWSNERYLALVESGMIEEGGGVELIDGQVIAAMPQGKLHNPPFLALQRAFAAMGLFEQGLAVQTTVVLRDGNTYDPKFVLLRAEYDPHELPRGEDVLWAVEVLVSSRPHRSARQEGGLRGGRSPNILGGGRDPAGRVGLHEPRRGGYYQSTFVEAGAALPVPVAGTTLDTGSIFPASETAPEES